jgi:hypothetical protein
VSAVAELDSQRRPLIAHDAFDVRSAFERGPGGSLCTGVVELIGSADDPVALVRCPRCEWEVGVRRADLERFRLPACGDGWWQK